MISTDLKKESPDYQREVLSKARLRQEQLRVLESPEYLIKLLGYSVASHHKEMLNFVLRENSNRAMILAPRGAGKSSIISIGFVLWSLLNNPSLIYDENFLHSLTKSLIFSLYTPIFS